MTLLRRAFVEPIDEAMMLRDAGRAMRRKL